MKTLISWWRNAVVQAILWCVLIFAAFYFIYEPIAFGFDWEDILLLSLPLLLGLAIFQQLMRSTLWHRAFLGHGLLGIAWALTYPLLYHWSYTKPFIFTNSSRISYLAFYSLWGSAYSTISWYTICHTAAL